MPLLRTFCVAGLLAAGAAPAFAATEGPATGPSCKVSNTPTRLNTSDFQSQGKSLQMGYMDVAGQGTANGRSVVLMHGKNFCGATWEGSIKALSDAGYRVIAPDQIGFCTSSKPEQLPVQLPATGDQHPPTAGKTRHSEGHPARPLHRRHARHPLRAAVPRANRATGAGQPDRPGRLESPRRALSQRRPMVRTRIAGERRRHPQLRARHLLRRPLEARIRALGTDARRHEQRPRATPRWHGTRR